MKQKLEESIDRAPPGYFHPKVKEKLPEAKQRLSKIADLIYDLGRLDERTQEVYVDEKSLRKLLRETPPAQRSRCWPNSNASLAASSAIAEMG